jgi:hypothetical protein
MVKKIHCIDDIDEDDTDLDWIRSVAPRDERSDILVFLFESNAFSKESAVDVSAISTDDGIISELKRHNRIKMMKDGLAYLTLIGKTVAFAEMCIRKKEG